MLNATDYRDTFLAGGGEMGERMRAHDWAGSPLGPLEAWPLPLLSIVSACLNSPMLTGVLWGPDLIVLYNDAYIPSMADRHPHALGRPVADVWGETWDLVAAPFHRAMATGEGFAQNDVELPIVRHGKPQTTHWDFTATPIRGEGGRICGLLNQGVEVTKKKVAERRLTREIERQRRIFQQMPGFVAVTSGPDHIYRFVNDAYVANPDALQFVGHSVRELVPELEDQGLFEALDRVYATGEPFSARAVPIRLAGEDTDRFIDHIYQPIRDEGGIITGIFVGGYDVTDRVRAEQALRESEDHFRHTVELNPQVPWTADPVHGGDKPGHRSAGIAPSAAE